MIRNLKALGLALVAIFAMSAMVASAASAQQGEVTSDGSWTGIGTEGEGANVFTAFGNEVECPGAEFTVHEYNETPHTAVPSSSTTVTVTPHYEAAGDVCKTTSGFFVTVDMNDCDFVFHIGETTPDGTYGVTADLDCSSSAKGYVAVTVFAGTNEGLKVCEVRMPEQAGLEGADVRAEGGKLIVEGKFVGIKANRLAGLCGGASEEEGATYQTSVVIEGQNAGEETTALELSELS